MAERKITIQTLRDMIKPRHNYRISEVNPVIVSNGRTLLLKEGSGETWSLPGGRVEDGEDTWAACVRVAKEAAGLEVSVTRMIGFYPAHVGKGGSDARMAFLCRPVSVKARPSPGASWFPIDGLPDGLAEGHQRMLSDARKHLGKGT